MKIFIGRIKNRYVLTSILILLANQLCLSQNYDYAKYLSELKLAGKMYSLEKTNNYDSLSIYLSKYENRLGYKYYYYKALLENYKGSSEQIKYLDSAFRRGLALQCMNNTFQLFDSKAIYKSFDLNYLKDYDEDYILALQRMQYLDQKYRGTISDYRNKLMGSAYDGSYNMDTLLYTIEQKGIKKNIDSLWRLQKNIDSLNFFNFNQLISEKGWPSAKLIGLSDCDYTKLPNPTLFVMHLGTAKPNYQIDNLKRVISLCLNNEESWSNAEALIFNIYNRFRNEYTEFSFLEVENNVVNETKSFFALHQMAELLIKKAAEIIEIKCRDVALFNDVRCCMIKVNTQIALSTLRQIYFELGRPQPEHLNESKFRFVQDKGIEKDKLFFRFVMQ